MEENLTETLATNTKLETKEDIKNKIYSKIEILPDETDGQLFENQVAETYQEDTGEGQSEEVNHRVIEIEFATSDDLIVPNQQSMSAQYMILDSAELSENSQLVMLEDIEDGSMEVQYTIVESDDVNEEAHTSELDDSVTENNLSILLHKHTNCRFCGKKYINKTSLNIHEVVCQKRNKVGEVVSDEGLETELYACQICGRQFNNPVSTRIHQNGCIKSKKMKNMPGVSNVDPFKVVKSQEIFVNDLGKTEYFECRICNKQYPNPISMRIHQNSCMKRKRMEKLKNGIDPSNKSASEDIPIELCNKCQKNFVNAVTLFKHDKNFHSEEPEAVQCEHCNYSCRNLNLYISHVKQAHSEKTEDDDTSSKKRNSIPSHLEDGELLTFNKVNLKELTEPKKASFKCQICVKQFRYKSSYEEHVKDFHSTSEKAIKCKQCKVVCRNNTIFKKHMENHQPKKFKCPYCPTQFTRNHHVTRHMEQKHVKHTEVNPNLVCNVCNIKFTRKDNLRVHLRWHIQKNSQDGYRCPMCKEGFTIHKALIRHYEKEHSPNPYECDHCGKTFPAKGLIMRHVEVHMEKKLKCEMCGFATNLQETLKRHRLRHVKDKPFKCAHCPLAFIQSHQLRAHEYRHTGVGTYTCAHCDETFPTKRHQDMHVAHVHEGKPELRCTEPDCKKYNKLFMSPQCYRQHMLIHGEKNYKCDVCDKRFHMPQLLKMHAISHTMQPPRRCLYCARGRAFIRIDLYIRHLRVKHPAVFATHLNHVRETLGIEDLNMTRLRKEEIEGLEHLLDALQYQMFEGTGPVSNSRASSASTVSPKLPSETTSPVLPVDKKVLEAKGPSTLMNEEQLAESLKQLVTKLIDAEILASLDWPNISVDEILEKIIEQCGQKAADKDKFNRVQCLRENAKYLFVYVIEDAVITKMLNTLTIDQVIRHIVAVSDS